MKQYIAAFAVCVGFSASGSIGCSSKTTDITPTPAPEPGPSSDAQPQPSSSGGGNGGNGGASDSGATFGGSSSSDGAFASSNSPTVDGSGIPTSVTAVIRDFRFYSANDTTTNADFENPPPAALTADVDDTDIVTDTIGSDGKPVYKNTNGTTATTHGKASFDQWYRDTAGTNIHVEYPLPMTTNADGSFGYDSESMGVPYNIQGVTGSGFFPIDDGSPYATAFGNQGAPHNYSFTVEIHTVFTYSGGEYFNFRGDDDVFVYIGGKQVINLGGIHGPESATVMLDTLGLSVGATYDLDFFSAERHEIGSNIEFTTTLVLKPPPR
jgi:fibro-slime domain-containing protein